MRCSVSSVSTLAIELLMRRQCGRTEQKKERSVDRRDELAKEAVRECRRTYRVDEQIPKKPLLTSSPSVSAGLVRVDQTAYEGMVSERMRMRGWEQRSTPAKV